ncbi:glycoside hydrolase [Glycocaulis profundi]|nr:glycoside hydrolase [Glycocaulis profundi]
MARAAVRGYAEHMLTEPPQALQLDPFYTQHVDAGGIPVTASSRVAPEAVLIARDIVLGMLSERPDIRHELVAMGVRVGVMALSETTTDLPEQSHWTRPAYDDPRLSYCDREDYARIEAMTDREYWDERARGMGGLYATVGAENLLGAPDTRYYGRSILVHEFAHSILWAIQRADPALRDRIERAYRNATTQGLWRGHYAALNIDEYWAEGSQYWFTTNAAYITDEIFVASPEQLADYDPMLFNVLAEVYTPSHRLDADVFHDHPARLDAKPADLERDCFSPRDEGAASVE